MFPYKTYAWEFNYQTQVQPTFIVIFLLFFYPELNLPGIPSSEYFASMKGSKAEPFRCTLTSII